jgi:hypothetical protein
MWVEGQGLDAAALSALSALGAITSSIRPYSRASCSFGGGGVKGVCECEVGRGGGTAVPCQPCLH